MFVFNQQRFEYVLDIAYEHLEHLWTLSAAMMIKTRPAESQG